MTYYVRNLETINKTIKVNGKDEVIKVVSGAVYATGYQLVASYQNEYSTNVQIIEGKGAAGGSGIFISKNLILTAEHVVRGESTSSLTYYQDPAPNQGTELSSVSDITVIRKGGFISTDMAVVETTEAFANPRAIMGLAVFGSQTAM